MPGTKTNASKRKLEAHMIDAPVIESEVVTTPIFDVPSAALEQVRVYRVVDSALQIRLSDAPVINLDDNPNWRKRDEQVTNLDFDPPALEKRYADVHEKSPGHGIELLYKTSRAEWEREQKEKNDTNH